MNQVSPTPSPVSRNRNSKPDASPSSQSHDELPAELLRRVERGLDARGFYVFGHDDFDLLWTEATSHLRREKVLLNFAAAVGADLQQGWTRNVALFVKR